MLKLPSVITYGCAEPVIGTCKNLYTPCEFAHSQVRVTGRPCTRQTKRHPCLPRHGSAAFIHRVLSGRVGIEGNGTPLSCSSCRLFAGKAQWENGAAAGGQMGHCKEPAKVRERSADVMRRARRALSRASLPLAAVCLVEAFSALSRQAAAQSDPAFVCPTDKPEDPWKEGDVKSFFCCREPRWENDWCYHDSCAAGEDCTANNQTTCPDLSQCLCFRRINYMTRSSCSLVKSCEQARRDMSMAKTKVLELTDFRVDELQGCQRALEGIICAYHFPKCIHDFHEQEKICMRTCDDVMKFCQYRPADCEPGSNVTLVDGMGQPILDENGQEQLVECNQTASYFQQAQAAGESAGNAAAGAAQSADDATGGALSSGAASAGSAASSASSSASSAVSGASNAMGGGRRASQDVIGGGYDSLESLRREALYQALSESNIPEYLLRKLRPLVATVAAREAFARAQGAGPQSFTLRQDTADASRAESAAPQAESADTTSVGGSDLDDAIDTSEEYYGECMSSTCT